MVHYIVHYMLPYMVHYMVHYTVHCILHYIVQAAPGNALCIMRHAMLALYDASNGHKYIYTRQAQVLASGLARVSRCVMQYVMHV